MEGSNEEMAAEPQQRPQVVLVVSPCIGHLIPFVELACHLVDDHGFAVTLIFNTADSSSVSYQSIFAAIPDKVDFIALSEPPPDAIPPDLYIISHIIRTVEVNLPRIRSILKSIASSSPLAGLVVDMNSFQACDIASDLGVPCYMFFTSPWTALALFVHAPVLDSTYQGEYRNATEPFQLPGCVPFESSDLISEMLDRNSEAYAAFLEFAEGITKAKVKGCLVNTFADLEPRVFTRLNGFGTPVYPVGPLVWNRLGEPGTDHEVLTWLHKQQRGSVVYVSFGSGGTLTLQQTKELALGLEMSGHRFIWVVKMPDVQAFGSFLGISSGDNPLDFLPDGFVNRTKGFGLVVQSWAPQTAILRHASTGGFMTHGGWNSVLESILNGVPMITWPLYAEQRTNAVMLKEVGVAARVEFKHGELVKREVIANVIKHVMDGEKGRKLRERTEELKVAAVHAISNGGSSFGVISKVAQELKDQMTRVSLS